MTTSTSTSSLREQLRIARLEMADALRDLGIATARLDAARSQRIPTRAYCVDATFAADDARRLARQVATLEAQLSQHVDLSVAA